MSIVAIVPVAGMTSANSALQDAGYGPRNFSVPAYIGGLTSHGALHAWNDAAFSAAIKAISGVAWQEGAGDPVSRTKALIEAQGAQWGAQAPPLTGNVLAGKLYRHTDQSLWSVIQSYNATTYPDPYIIPALVKRARQPGVFEPWVPPTGAHDAYNLPDPFTGVGEVCSHAGKNWRTKVNANVWEPAAGALWEQVP